MDSATTKLRVVYDASAKSKKGNKSLNDCLHRSPVLLQDLCGILLQFRFNNIVLISDIQKAFLQVGPDERDRDVTRFLWPKDIDDPTIEGNIETYRFCRIPFGMISSPFPLEATIAHSLKKSEGDVARNILRNIYVDNVICGTSTVEDASKFYREAKEVFRQASMNLKEWCSNSDEFLASVPDNEVARNEELKVLGIMWNRKSDEMSISTKKSAEETVKTKRQMLHTLASIFDLLGYFSPVILRGKLLIQKIWHAEHDWDDPLPDDILRYWRCLLDDLKLISSLKMARYLGSVANAIELHCFADASRKSFCDCNLRLNNVQQERAMLVDILEEQICPKQEDHTAST